MADAHFGREFADAILRQMQGGEPFRVEGLWLGLLTKLPLDGADVAVEVSAQSYQRLAVPLSAPREGMVQNEAEMLWPRVSEGWGTLQGFAVYDQPKGGTLLVWSAFEDGMPRRVERNDLPHVLAGEYVLLLP